MIISDDIGSFPLPGNVKRERIQEIAFSLIKDECSDEDRKLFDNAISGIFESKLKSGLQRPNYPQVQDMIASFFTLIEKFSEENEPWVVKKNFAKIPEIQALDEAAKKYYEEKNKPVELRVCVTGPLELYVKNIGFQVEPELLKNLAKSVSNFVENSIINKKYLKTKTVSIDEPSLGLNPNLIYEPEAMIKAFDDATDVARSLDVQIHLHSSSESTVIQKTKNINVIGIEAAENPKNLDSINKKELESADKFLRVGIARTSFNSLAQDYEKITGVNVWKTNEFEKVVNEVETKDGIIKRIEHAHKIFGDMIKYAGPDCGLGLWPDTASAFRLLKNTCDAINEFNNRRE